MGQRPSVFRADLNYVGTVIYFSVCLCIIPFAWNIFLFSYLANLYFKVSSNLIYEDSLILIVLLTAYSSQDTYEPLMLLLLLLSHFDHVQFYATP